MMTHSNSWIVRLTILSLIAIVHLQSITASQNEAYTRLELVCKSKVDLKTIADFRQFVSDLKAIKRDFLDKKSNVYLIKCLDELEAFEALDKLVRDYNRERPCKLVEVNKLEDYARKYLLNNKKSLVSKFFTLFGVNIGLKCKLNLLAHVKQADLEAEQLDFIYSMASPTGWNVLINEYTKKSMKFGTSAHADSHVINRIARLVPGLSLVDQLDYLNFDHVMNENNRPDWKGVERGSHELKNVELRGELINSVNKIIDSCQNLDKFYVNNLLSLAKLRELGLVVDFLNDLHEKSVLLHKWLAAASFCQLMARVRLITSKDDKAAKSVEFEIIHDDKQLEGRRKLYSYVAKFDEIDKRACDLVWHASVNEGAWRQKGEAMWVPGNDGTSIAMRQVRQFISGLEHGFQEDKEAEANFEG